MSERVSETVADIIREKRGMAAEIRTHLSNVPARREDQLLDADSLDREAYRIETAWKRDEERAVEHATRHAEAVARDNCRDCVHSPRGRNYEGGNAAAMREALVQCELFLGNVSRHGHPTLNPGDKCTACDGVDELRGLVVRALAAPPRNCDRFADAETARQAWLYDAENWDEFGSPNLELYEWLFAPAAKREGEGDGSK